MISVELEAHYFEIKKDPLMTLTVACDEQTGEEVRFSLWKNIKNANDFITKEVYSDGALISMEYPATIFRGEAELRGYAERVAKDICIVRQDDRDKVKEGQLGLYLETFPSLFRRVYTDKRKWELGGFEGPLNPVMASNNSWFYEIKALLDQTASEIAGKQVDVIEQNLGYMNQLLRFNTFYTLLDQQRLKERMKKGST